ncbi:MAG: outer membrane protein transport protein [Bdellovibrionales bacterium]|nr:outer membrane protein transport protein [Bdellovibrionales bacterium]
MKKAFTAGILQLVGFLCSSPAIADFANYNSILIGHRAAGMGGAYTALSGDPAAISFYNPANLSLMHGNTLSAAVTLFNKYDTSFGKENEFDQAPLKVNRGSITPIPASGGTAYTFGNFAFGISIVYPDLDQFNGEVRSTSTTNSYLNLKDSSLWIGGSFAVNWNRSESFGLSMYYTSRNFSRSITDRTETGGVTTITNEEKTFTQNSLIYILGWTHRLSKLWRLGVSYRPASLPVSGEGTLFSSQISTSGTNNSQTYDLQAETIIPDRLAIGIGYELEKDSAFSFDIHYYGKVDYRDLKDTQAGDLIKHEPMANIALGYEHYFREWLSLRTGVFTNFSSHPQIDDNPTRRQPDHIDMWGFSTNIGIHTTQQSSITLGGYYSGGKGWSVQQVGQSLEKIKKNNQIFSFLVGTSYQF